MSFDKLSSQLGIEINNVLELKQGWKLKKLGEVCAIKPPKKEAKERVDDDSLVSFLPMEDLGVIKRTVNANKEKPLKEVRGSYTYFANDDVLLAKITPCFENGKLGIVRNLKNGIGFGSSEYIVFRTKESLLKEYLFYYLSQESFREEGRKNMTGAVGHKRVSKEFIENYKIPLPPLPEQQRIVSILDKAFAAIDKAKANAERCLSLSKELFESYLQGVFYNHDWEKKKLAEVVKLISGQHIDSKEYNIQRNGIGYLTGPADFGKVYPKVSKWTESPKRNALKGDILITVKGSGVGKINLMIEDELCISRQLMAIRPLKVNTSYLYSFLSIKYDYFQSLSNGAAIPGISREDVLNLRIVIPDIHVQQAIVHQLDALRVKTQKLEALYQKKINNLEELKKSILQKAFAGELTFDKSSKLKTENAAFI